MNDDVYDITYHEIYFNLSLLLLKIACAVFEIGTTHLNTQVLYFLLGGQYT